MDKLDIYNTCDNKYKNDCSLYYIYKALNDKLNGFIQDISNNNTKSISMVLPLENVLFHTVSRYQPNGPDVNFIPGNAYLDLSRGLVYTKQNRNESNCRFLFTTIKNEKFYNNQINCYEVQTSEHHSNYEITETAGFFEQNFLYTFDKFTSISKDDINEFQTRKNTILSAASTIGDLIKEYNKILSSIYLKLFKNYNINIKEINKFIENWFKNNNINFFTLNLGNDLENYLSKKYES
jgi:hypothetical protein